jgi:hypothetical protein
MVDDCLLEAQRPRLRDARLSEILVRLRVHELVPFVHIELSRRDEFALRPEGDLAVAG